MAGVEDWAMAVNRDISDVGLQKLSAGLAITHYDKALTHNNWYVVDISILICNVISTRNVAKLGANFLFFFRGNIGSMIIKNSTSSMANHLLTRRKAQDRTGLAFIYEPSLQIHTTSKTLLQISDSRFHDNNGGGVNFQLVNELYGIEIHNNVKYHVIIKNCSFHRNMNVVGSGAI